MPAPICGNLIGSKHDLLKLGWTITTLVTAAVFISSMIFVVRDKALYRSYVNYYAADDDGGDDGEQNSGDYSSMVTNMATLKSTSLRFASIYTAVWAGLLVTYGGSVVFNGVSDPLKLGMYMGAIVMFVNWALVSAFLFGELWVDDYTDERDKENLQEELGFSKYALERSSMAFSTLCIILSFVYMGFASLLFLFQETILIKSNENEIGRESTFSHMPTEYAPPNRKADAFITARASTEA